MTTLPEARDFDCGDGVPDLPLLTDRAGGRFTGDGPAITARVAIMGLVVLAQFILLLAVLAGGNPFIGAGAAAALLICGLTMIGVRRVNLDP